MKKEIIKNAMLNAGVAASYIIIVVSVFFGPNSVLNGMGAEDAIIGPIVLLLLLVISVAVMAITIFGRSVMWYLDGKKKEAVQLLGYTLGFLVIIALFFISIALF